MTMLFVEESLTWTRAVVLAASAFGLAACDKQATDAAPTKQTADIQAPPVMDASTPDRAVKSWWAMRDWAAASWRKNLRVYTASTEYETTRKMMDAVGAKGIFESEARFSAGQTAEEFGRSILQATVETESRAVVLAEIKNTTPLPKDADLDKYGTEAREIGVRVRYVLEKEGAVWKVAEVWEWRKYENAFGKVLPNNSKHYPVYVNRLDY